MACADAEEAMTHIIPEQAIYRAHEHLENAESELAYFIREAKPQNEEAQDKVEIMKIVRQGLRTFIKAWEKDFYEIAEDLPELSEDDYRNGGR